MPSLSWLVLSCCLHGVGPGASPCCYMRAYRSVLSGSWCWCRLACLKSPLKRFSGSRNTWVPAGLPWATLPPCGTASARVHAPEHSVTPARGLRQSRLGCPPGGKPDVWVSAWVVVERRWAGCRAAPQGKPPSGGTPRGELADWRGGIERCSGMRQALRLWSGP